jgi:hypothetical protein
MDGDKGLHTALVQHLRETWKGQHDSLLEQVAAALGVDQTATSECKLQELWTQHAPAPKVLQVSS